MTHFCHLYLRAVSLSLPSALSIHIRTYIHTHMRTNIHIQMEEEAVILTDILGLEDSLGTMDFKVAL